MFSCSVFLMSQITVTTAITTPPVTIMSSRAMPITRMIMLAPTSLGQATLGQHDVVLLSQVILRDTVTGSAALTIVQHQQQPQSQMPSQAYAIYAMGPPQVSFSFRVESPTDSLCHVSWSVIVFAVCFQVPMWLPGPPMGM